MKCVAIFRRHAGLNVNVFHKLSIAIGVAPSHWSVHTCVPVVQPLLAARHGLQFCVALTTNLGAESFVHVTSVQVLSLVFLWCCPRPGVMRGQGWASHRCHATGFAAPLVSPCLHAVVGSSWFFMRPHGCAPSLPPMQRLILHPSTCDPLSWFRVVLS